MSKSSQSEAQKHIYKGNCHCNRVQFTAEVAQGPNEGEIVRCNCSICTENGLYWVYGNESDVRFESGKEEMTGYKFGDKKAEHWFCPTCGTNVWCMSADPNFNPGLIALNVRVPHNYISSSNERKTDGEARH